ELNFRDGLLQPERSHDCALGIIWMRDWSAKECKNSVPEQIADRATLLPDNICRHSHESIQQIEQNFRWSRVAGPRVATEVGEHGCDLTSIPAKLQCACRITEDASRDTLADVATKNVCKLVLQGLRS